MFPITCNAFGDIVAVIQLVLELVKALDDTRGAAVKYRLFVQELESLSIMMGEAYRVAEGAPSTLQLLVLKEIQICTNNIEDAYRRTRGFEKLGESSQKRTVKTKLLKRLVRKPLGLAAKKAHWHFRRTTDAQKYREIFRDCLQRLDFIVGLISCCRLNAQIPAIVHYNIEHVIIFIDAFGERIPVALQLCRSMEVFHGFLTYLFENHQRKGSTFVRQGLYELYTGEDHRVITPSIWLSCMQPGARVEMGIILRHIGAGAGLSGCLPTCPYCGSTTPILRDHDEYECIVCFKSFRASTEIASFDEPSQTHCPFSSPERPAAVHDLTPPVHQVAIVTNEVEQREPDARASESTRDFVRIRVVTLQLVAMCLNNPPRESQPEPLLDDPNPVTVEAIPTPQADPLPIGQDESTPITLPDLIAISQAEPAPTPQDEPLCTQDEPAPVLQAEPVLVSWIEPAPFPQAERAPSQSQAVNEHDEDLTTGAIGHSLVQQELRQTQQRPDDILNNLPVSLSTRVQRVSNAILDTLDSHTKTAEWESLSLSVLTPFVVGCGSFAAVALDNPWRITSFWGVVAALGWQAWGLSKLPMHVSSSCENAVTLTNLLGESITIPYQLCCSIEMFELFLHMFYSEREREAGREAIEQRRYKAYVAGTSQVVSPDNWSTCVKPGACLEMVVPTQP